MTRKLESSVEPAQKAGWSVVVIYEDPGSRERAVTFCDRLVGRLWADLELDVSWWPFSGLEEAASAREAAEKAIHSDVIVFAAASEGELPLGIKSWLDAWLDRRADREGKLVALLQAPEQAPAGEGVRHFHLRSAAHRAGLDYLTEVPEDISLVIPESFDSYTQRACQVTGLLDDILHRQPPPPTRLP
jgi:hypothetical protein